MTHAQELTVALEAPDVENTPFVADEQMPRLIGGMEEIVSKIGYPRMAELAQMHGKITIEFTVDEEGNVTDAHPLERANWLGVEALRAIETLTFEPARQNGRAVPVKMHLPLTFIISGLTD